MNFITLMGSVKTMAQNSVGSAGMASYEAAFW